MAFGRQSATLAALGREPDQSIADSIKKDALEPFAVAAPIAIGPSINAIAIEQSGDNADCLRGA
jgi:hypothetical protein